MSKIYDIGFQKYRNENQSLCQRLNCFEPNLSMGSRVMLGHKFLIIDRWIITKIICLKRKPGLIKK